MQAHTFDIRRFITDLGGPIEVHRMLLQLGFDVQMGTIRKWRERGDIALPYLVNLMVLQAYEAGPIDLYRYFVQSDDLRVPRRPPPAPEPALATQQPLAVQG